MQVLCKCEVKREMIKHALQVQGGREPGDEAVHISHNNTMYFTQFNSALAVQQDILRLDVSVDNLLHVAVVDCLADAKHHLKYYLQGIFQLNVLYTKL